MKYWSPRLHQPYSHRPYVESFLPTSFLVSQNPSSTQGFTFRPVCCLSYAMIDIGPGDILIFAILPSATVPCSSLCMIILYGGSPIIIIKNKPEPSNLHCTVLRLDGFHTLKICLGLWITSWRVRVFGQYFYLCWKYGDTSLESMFLTQGGERPSTGRWWS